MKINKIGNYNIQAYKQQQNKADQSVKGEALLQIRWKFLHGLKRCRKCPNWKKIAK
ncbi:hypothetical protein ACPJHQ_21705 [Rossellomorea sp. H39__3]